MICSISAILSLFMSTSLALPLLSFSSRASPKIVPRSSSANVDDIAGMMYLARYGYMNETVGPAQQIHHAVFENAIKDFQRFAGLNETGILDEETKLMMQAPRCGNKDIVGHAEQARRKKRYALQGSKWRKAELSYKISKYSRQFSKDVVDREIARAFKVWSEATPMNFVKKDSSRVHIDIQFVRGEHGDGDPFDGPGQTLAHAYFPQYGGDAHFDDDERWSINSYSGTNLFQVAAHELGHSLGLGHSSVRDSLMAPFYQRYKPNFQLHKDDVLGIQALYGKRKESEATIAPTTKAPKPRDPDESGDAPDLCQDGKIDAVTRIANGNTYVFKGNYYWKVETNGLSDGYPRKISTDWDGLPGDLDAVLTWADGKTFFFKGSQYWRFHNMNMDSGYPKDIEVGFAGIPANIDAAFVWSGNGKTYFLKGSNYWRFDSKSDPPVSSRYPKPIKNWVGLPNDIDAAFKWENGLTYFFKGADYYRFNDVDFEVDGKAKPPFPRQTSVWWFDCKSAANAPKRSSLTSSQRKPVYVGAMNNAMDEMQASASSSNLLETDGEKSWVKHGSISSEEQESASLHEPSNSSCKTNVNLLALVTLTVTVINTVFPCSEGRL